MNLTLDATPEKRIQREIERGHYREPSEVVAQALALLEDQEDWLFRDKDAINQRLDESHAQICRGEGLLRMKYVPSSLPTAPAEPGERLSVFSARTR